MSTQRSHVARIALALSLCALVAPSAFGLAQRTFVASYGVDTNPCSLASPCRSFGAAIAQTASAGEVIVIDSAGYGAVTITQSVSIIAPAGVYAGVSVVSPASLVGVTINAPGITVLLQNLAINGLGANTGILVQQGAELYVNNCTVSNFQTAGIYSTAANSKIYVQDTIVRDSGGPGAFGVWLAASTSADLDHVRVESNASDGIRVEAGASASIKRSVVSRNGGAGVSIDATTAVTRVSIESTLVSDNTGDGITASASGAGAIADVAVARATITRNNNGVSGIGSAPATITMSVADNLISQNAADGVDANGFAVTILASGNTFSTNATFALDAVAGGTIHTVNDAAGQPNNSGEQTTPTNGNVVAVNPF